MIAMGFWVGLAALIAGMIKDSVPIAIFGASLFVPASFTLLVVGMFVRVETEARATKEDTE